MTTILSLALIASLIWNLVQYEKSAVLREWWETFGEENRRLVKKLEETEQKLAVEQFRNRVMRVVK